MNILLIGRKNKVNTSIENIFREHPEVNLIICDPSSLSEEEGKRMCSNSHILAIDLSSVSLKPVDALRQMKETCPEKKILAIHNYQEAEVIHLLKNAGANAYISLETTEAELLETLRELAENRDYFPMLESKPKDS